MANLTLLDLVARSNSDPIVGLVEDVITVAPEFQRFPVVTRPGTTYRTTRRTALPDSGFRSANEGATPSKSNYVQEIKEMYFLDCQLEVDEAIVKGDDRELGDILADEAAGALRSTFITIGAQVYEGTNADSKGFAGLKSFIDGNTAHEVSATGTSGTSAYLVWLNPKGVHLSVGRDGAIEMPDWRVQQVSDAANSARRYMAYVSNISAYIGMCVASENSVYRVKDITTANGKAMTDALGAELLSKVPLMNRDGLVWLMNRTAAFTLQQSRSAIGQVDAGATGVPAYAPMPTECQGIPIVLTDSIPAVH